MVWVQRGRALVGGDGVGAVVGAVVGAAVGDGVGFVRQLHSGTVHSTAEGSKRLFARAP